MADEVQGVPAGVTGTPITGVPAGVTGTPLQPTGVPTGVTATPITAQPSLAQQFWAARPHPVEELIGVAKGAGQTAAGLLENYARTPGYVTGVVPGTEAAAQRMADWLRLHSQTTNQSQKEGALGETLAEYMALPELDAETMTAKLPAIAERLGQGAKLAEFLSKNPKALTLMNLGVNSLKGGAAQGTQQLLKTGDTASVPSAALYGTLGELGLRGAAEMIGGGAGAVAQSAAEAAPQPVEIAGEQVPRVAAGARGATQAAQAAEQQTGMQNALGTVLNRTLRRGLEPYDRFVPRPAQDFGDVADQLKDAATTGFDELTGRARVLHGDEVSQRVNELNQAVNDAPLTERPAAKQQLFDYLDSVDDPRYPESLRDAAVQTRNTYQQHFMADDLHKMMTKYFNYPSPETAALMEKPYSLELAGRGETMKADLEKFEQDYGHEAVTNFLGRDGFKNLQDMADVASDPTYNENADSILRQVLSGAYKGQKGKWIPASLISHFSNLPFLETLGALKTIGAVKGGTEAALPMLKYQIATNPRLGAMLSYSAKAGLAPRYVAPFLHAAIYGEMNERQRDQTQTPTPPASAQSQARTPAISGMVQEGNIDVNHRPVIWNNDGTPSTIYSATIPIGGGKWALVPTIANGRFLTPDGRIPKEGDREAQSALEAEATKQYNSTGEHLGIFDSQQAADAYAERTHGWMPNGRPEQVFTPSYSGESNMPLTRKEYEAALAKSRPRRREPPIEIPEMIAPARPRPGGQ